MANDSFANALFNCQNRATLNVDGSNIAYTIWNWSKSGLSLHVKGKSPTECYKEVAPLMSKHRGG